MGVACLCAAGVALADPAWYDLAPVVAVTPVVHTVQVPVAAEVCRPALVQEEITGEAHGPGADDEEAPTLAESIAAELAQAPRCRPVTTLEPRQTIVGYDVRYRYAGVERVRRMDRPPGAHVRVRVELRTLPAAR